VQILGESGKPLKAVLPLKIDVLDPLLQASEWNRYTATDAEGTCRFDITPAVNDASGTWLVRVTDLIAGKIAECRVMCE
jgi:hypothetical protein